MAKLYFRYGAMNSGKSTALMQVAYNYEERGMRERDKFFAEKAAEAAQEPGADAP